MQFVFHQLSRSLASLQGGVIHHIHNVFTGLSAGILADKQPAVCLVAKFCIEAWNLCPPINFKVHDLDNL